MKPLSKVKFKPWTPELSYAIGLIVSDGCLYSDGRHINFTSKDLDQIETFKRCLGINNRIWRKARGSEFEKRYFNLQFGDVNFYRFLNSIGIAARKSKTIKKVIILDRYFFDFLRGLFDGDGCSYSYWDPRWKSSFMFYIAFSSASETFTNWLRGELHAKIGVFGHITRSKGQSCLQLKYAKREALVIVGKMYHKPGISCLKRKHLKIMKTLSIINQRNANGHVEKLVYSQA